MGPVGGRDGTVGWSRGADGEGVSGVITRQQQTLQRLLQGGRLPPTVRAVSEHARQRWAERKGPVPETFEEAYAHALSAGRLAQWTGWQYRMVVLLCEEDGDERRIVTVWTGSMWARKWHQAARVDAIRREVTVHPA
jgi:hypothetical protein